MNKLESLQLFLEKDVKKISLNKLLELENYYQQNKDMLVDEFISSFKASCRKALEMQKANKKGKVGYITYSMLRTSMLENKSNYLIEVSDENWFLDTVECTSEYDANWAFRFLYEFYKEISIAKKPYAGLIGDWEIDKLKYKEAEKYNEYIVALARYAAPRIIELEEFKQLELEKEFELRIGEYRYLSESVYKIDNNEKDSVLVKAFFEEKDEDDEYSYEVYTNLNLSNGDYKELDFRYCNFSGSKFDKSNMKKSILLGVNFSSASMKKVDFRDSVIYEANFQNADLSFSNFSRVSGLKGMPRKNRWTEPGYEKVNFANSNLEGTKFRNADLKGANFLNAIFKDTDFYGADLTEAVFSIESKDILSLSENQIKVISWR